MVHLPSYKSFNFHDVEEIEQRVFCPLPIRSDNALRVTPGSLNIQDDIHRSIIHQQQQQHSSHWDSFQYNVHNLFHHAKPKDSVIVHVNENFSERETEVTILERNSDEDELALSLETPLPIKKSRRRLRWRKKKITQSQTTTSTIANTSITKINEDNKSKKKTTWHCLFCSCLCAKSDIPNS